MSYISLLPWIIVSAGMFLTVKLSGFHILHPIKSLRLAFSGEKTRDAIASLTLALAGTLGVGNIVGVTVGICIGGAGSLFWLMVSACFSAVIKYSEVTLSADAGTANGIIGVIKKSFPFGKVLSCVYAALCLALSVVMGARMQAEAIKVSAEGIGCGTPKVLAPFLILLTIFICLGGGKSIKKAVIIIIPIASILYTGLCLTVILPKISMLPRVALLCVKDAFSPDSAIGGILGFFVSDAIREGFARGLLSNEAGAGTSSFAHTALPERYAARAGILGILEVLFDTVFLCALTGFTVLLGADGELSGGMSLLCKIFASEIGNGANHVLLFSVIAFAMSTVLCWYYYGKICLGYLFGNRGRALFFIIFILSFSVGLYREFPGLIFIADTLLFFLSVISVLAVIKNSDRVRTLSESVGLIGKSSKKPDS
jgi:AGCS family alanine or glycine:cation symporter